ncbi:MAG: 4-hydroxythreonine-4-phosphate dehydrogenase PdxA [Thermodesulfobacteriota bacterium]
MTDKPVIAVTMGDAAGVGPEVILKALRSRKVRSVARPVIVGDECVLRKVALKTGLPFPRSIEIINPAPSLSINGASLAPGRLGTGLAKATPLYIKEAVRMALKGEAAAVVTAPINKAVLNKKAGFKYPGHTEFIAHLTGSKDYAMMLGGARLKVILVTIHEPLRDVPKLITCRRVLKTIEITADTFNRYFGIKKPRIGVAGLNPHAGEGAMFGDEEMRIIGPAIKKAQKAGINAIGPVAPDTVFMRAVAGEFDCVVAMYHDQGLAPLKLIHFEDAINTTLGLPIIRTSVDHGTAYDIAWKGVASARSMKHAIVTAAEMAARKVG